MMATSMGPNFTGHPAGMGHPGVPGHPMGPGMPPNAQGAPGGGMPQQFAGGHMGVGPGGQVNPALMGAMPPGANPQAYALQHMNPAQQQMFQQQQQQQQQQLQNQFNNPSAMAAMRQQQLLQNQQAQARQAFITQQAMQANMHPGVNGMPMGMHLSQLNPQQIQQLRQSGRIGPGQHPQAQAIMAHQLALQQQQQQQAQQQAAQNQQMQGGPNQGQMPVTPQGMPGPQQPQMGGPQGQPGQGQPPQGGQPTAQHTPQQQGSQAGTPAPSGQHTPSQTPAPPTPSQPTQQPQGNPQQPPQGAPQQQPGGPQMQGQNQQMNAAAQAAAAQQMAMANNLFQQQRREGMKGQCMLKLMQFAEHLSGYPGVRAKDDLSYWTTFVMRFFSPAGVFRHSLHISEGEESSDKQYEISYPAIARYFHTHFASGVKSMQLILDKGLTDRPLPGDCHCIENTKASLVFWYETGSHLVSEGTLRVQFDAEQRIEVFEFLTVSHEEYISRKQVIDAAKPAHMWMKDWHKLNTPDGKTSPEMSKKSKAKQLKSPQTQPPEVLVDLPDSAVNSKGVTQAVHQFLEIVEVIGQMNPLFGFCHGNPGVGPYAALDQYVSTHINGAGGQGMNGQPMPQGPRTPSFGQFPMGASPANAKMNLPGSPHIGSPAPGQMQAPNMALQQSQQGTTSSGGPSANTSPASNKRRRPSAVKAEDDGSGAGTPAAQVNGAGRGKPATPRMPKRAKANPS